MTTYVSLQTPDTSVKREAGWCLSHTQAVFKAPIMYPSATAAANATKQRSASRNMPNVPVPVWFDHWGTYQGKYDNWGHVVAWIPGHGFLSSPTSGYGQQWLPSIEAVERAFNAKFRFWSLDINTKIVAEEVHGSNSNPTPNRKEGDPMPRTSQSSKKGTQVPGDGWTTLTVHEKGYVSVIEGGATTRRVRGIINLAISKGSVDVRAVRVVTNPDGTKQISAHTLPFKSLTPGYGDYVYGLDLPPGKTNRVRIQVRARGAGKPQVDNVQVLTDWWE